MPAVLKSSLVTPVVTDHQGSQAAMQAFFSRMLKSSCALKGVGPSTFPAPVALPVEEHGRCSGGSPGLALAQPCCSLMYSSFLMVFILLIRVPLKWQVTTRGHCEVEAVLTLGEVLVFGNSGFAEFWGWVCARTRPCSPVLQPHRTCCRRNLPRCLCPRHLSWLSPRLAEFGCICVYMSVVISACMRSDINLLRDLIYQSGRINFSGFSGGCCWSL